MILIMDHSGSLKEEELKEITEAIFLNESTTMVAANYGYHFVLFTRHT